MGCALVSFPGPGMWVFRFVERCCVFASLVGCLCPGCGLCWFACLGWVVLFLCCFIRCFCVGLMPLSYIFRGGAARFLFFLGAFGYLF